MDSVELEIAMQRKGISYEKLSEIIGISRSAFYRKMKGQSEFTQGEIQRIVYALELDSPMGIFFATKVS